MIRITYTVIFVSLIAFLSSLNLKAERYAILISAGKTTTDGEFLNSFYWYDLFLAYEDLIIKEGFTHGNVFVCYGDGASYNSDNDRYKLSLHGWSDIVDYDNDKETIFDVFDNLGNMTNSDDHVVIWWSGHGETYSGGIFNEDN